MFESTLIRYLHDPAMVMAQLLCPMKHHERAQLIELYYGLDDVVLRRMIGHQMTAKVRKDLEVVAASSGLEVRRCAAVAKRCCPAFHGPYLHLGWQGLLRDTGTTGVGVWWIVVVRVAVDSCYRQFDNLRRIHHHVEDGHVSVRCGGVKR